MHRKPDQSAKHIKADHHADAAYARRRKIISVLSFAVLLTFFVVVAIFVGKPLLKMIENPDSFRQWVDASGILGRFAMVGMVALQVIVAVIPGEPIELGAGYAFGSIEGLLLCLAGAALGSTIVFLFTRRFGIKMVEAFISREKLYSLKFIKSSKRLDLLIFILFFIPGTPKDILTYFVGLTPIKLSTFLLITTVARIPSVITSTLTGNALGVERYTLAVIVFVITLIGSALGALWYMRITKQEKREEMEGR